MGDLIVSSGFHFLFFPQKSVFGSEVDTQLPKKRETSLGKSRLYPEPSIITLDRMRRKLDQNSDPIRMLSEEIGNSPPRRMYVCHISIQPCRAFLSTLWVSYYYYCNNKHLLPAVAQRNGTW